MVFSGAEALAAGAPAKLSLRYIGCVCTQAHVHIACRCPDHLHLVDSAWELVQLIARLRSRRAPGIFGRPHIAVLAAMYLYLIEHNAGINRINDQ